MPSPRDRLDYHAATYKERRASTPQHHPPCPPKNACDQLHDDNRQLTKRRATNHALVGAFDGPTPPIELPTRHCAPLTASVSPRSTSAVPASRRPPPTLSGKGNSVVADSFTMSLSPSPAPHTVQQCGTQKRRQQGNTTTSNEGMAPKKKARDGRTKIYIGGYEYTRADITSVKISYRCSFYRSQECPGKIEFFSSIMDYDFEDMVERVCAPPSRPSLNGRAASETHDVTAAMKREVDRLAVAGTSTPQQIRDSVRDSFYARDDDLVIRGLSCTQAIKRIHRARAIHFDRDMHGRVEVPPL